MFLIVPPQVFIERLAHGQWYGGYLDFYAQRVLQFQPYPAGDFSWHHLWFIVYLYVYVLLLVPLMLWWRRAQRAASWRVDYALALPLGINEALLKPLFPESHNLVQRLVHLQSLSAAHDVRLRAGVDARRLGLVRAAPALVARARHSPCCSAVLALIEVGVIHARHRRRIRVFANVFTWVWLMVFLGYGRQHLCFGNRLLALGARCELSGLHPAPDRDHRDRVLRDPAALGAVDQVLGGAGRDAGHLRAAL